MGIHFVAECNCIQKKMRPLLRRPVWSGYCIVPFEAYFDYDVFVVVGLCSCEMDGESKQLVEIEDRLVSVQVEMKMWMRMKMMRKSWLLY